MGDEWTVPVCCGRCGKAHPSGCRNPIMSRNRVGFICAECCESCQRIGDQVDIAASFGFLLLVIVVAATVGLPIMLVK